MLAEGDAGGRGPTADDPGSPAGPPRPPRPRRARRDRARSSRGKEFPATAVASWSRTTPAPSPRGTWRHSVGKELLNPVRSLRPDQESFRFRHVLIQQATYRAIPKRLRARFHEQVAEWLSEASARKPPSTRSPRASTLSRRAATAELARSATRSRGRAPRERPSCLRRSASLPARRHACDSEPARPSGRAPYAEGLDRPRRATELGYALFEIGEVEEASTLLADAQARARTEGIAKWSGASPSRARGSRCTGTPRG